MRKALRRAFGRIAIRPVRWRPIVRRPDVCGGALTIAGTRISVFLLEDYYREVESIPAVLTRYPSLSPAQVHAALAYAHMFPRQVQKDRDRHERALAQLMAESDALWAARA